MDRAIAPAAKQAISRQLAEVEAQRTGLLATLDGLHVDASDNLEGLAAIIRETFAAARENLQAVATPEQFNRFVEQFVGAMVVEGEGTVAQRKVPAALAAGTVSDPSRVSPIGLVGGS